MPTSTQSHSGDKVKCLAAKEKGGPVSEWEYTARPLGPHDIELAIDYCGVCGTDCSQIDTGYSVAEYPFVPGHEIIGRAVKLGDKVQGFSEGERVGVSWFAWSCEDGSSQCDQCRQGNDVYCQKAVSTAGGKYPDGSISYGGYADSIRVHQKHVMHIPDNLDSKLAAPITCGGSTVFTPMTVHNVKAGDCVGIVGIGGLGHMAIMFAKALGAEVTAFTTKEDKCKECLELGAHHAVNLKDAKQVSRAENSIDFLLVCSNSPHINWDQLASFVSLHGKIVLVGIPPTPIKISAANLLLKNISLSTSVVGNAAQVQQSLDFAAKHHIKPILEELPMSKANDGIQRVKDGDVRYRVVLHR
ncbi:hypothetical protein IWQ60_008904 [Tieghemiomyces parasiticus]|uniref:Enoyl reductase (ER) domain-containing protein n=1 Tax=Tieghemiomyces parasiticus TaxID=78921 RepID=A0A9W7ZY90_9FUNG|nr:hypothetical protein IWQ60_008904 [Tieghemiomyces parasiticus]